MKSMLVIDTPENCAECPLRYWGIGGWSCICTRRLLEGPIAEREEWCPLRTLPSKEFWHKKDYANGWNACLDEIEGETE